MKGSIEKRLQTLEQIANVQDVVHITPNFETFEAELNPGSDTTAFYHPYPTTYKFHASDTKVRLVMGPYGSGKSSACCMEIIFRAIRMCPDKQGKKRSRWAIIRNTAAELQTTALKTWLDWTTDLGIAVRHVDPLLRYNYSFNANDCAIELEILFLALDRPTDIKKLKSLELTGAWVNEAAEINESLFEHLQFRIGRYPSHADVLDYWHGIIVDTNPPDTSHWIYYLFEERDLEEFEIFHQPPGLLEQDGKYLVNPEAENVEFLPGKGRYYLQNAAGKSKEFVRVYCMGQYGIVVSGQRVYSGYNDDIHSVPDISLDPCEPILLAWDYGTVSPACLLVQYSGDRLCAIKEFTCKYMSVKELFKASVAPFLAQYCSNMSVIAIGDPADTYEGSRQLEECGLLADGARTNRIGPRISAVSDFLSQLVQGQPRLLVSRQGCPNLRKGFLGEYHYRRLQVIGEERYRDEPNKNHPYSDIHDCLQYAALHYLDPLSQDEEYDGYEDVMHDYNEETRSLVTGY